MKPSGLDHIRGNPHACIRWLKESNTVDGMNVNNVTLVKLEFPPLAGHFHKERVWFPTMHHHSGHCSLIADQTACS